ncbi:MAG: phosphatidylserine/phosphatidylglycerophosphate/cardiolipin synthase family protein [Bacteriovoracaceae bacterium]
MTSLKHYLGPQYSYFNCPQFLLDGEKYVSTIVKLIEEAKVYIHIQTYIWEEDQVGVRIIDAIVKAAERNVAIFILLDSIGSSKFSSKTIELFLKHKICFEWFNKPSKGSWRNIGRRLHQKVMIFDNHTAIVGGINIVDSYQNNNTRLDFAFLIEGELVEKVTKYCEFIFTKSLSKKESVTFPPFPPFIKDENLTYAPLRMRVNDWMRGKTEITYSYNTMLTFTKKSIVIVNSYFLPNRKFLRRLVNLKHSKNLDVKIVVPQKSDWQSWQWATAYLYPYLIKNNIEVYECDKSILHGKLMICDSEWVLMGSYNLNFTSYFGNIELNIEALSSDFSKKMSQEVDEIIQKKCIHINPIFKKNFEYNIVHVFRNFLFYSLIQLVAFFSIRFKSRQKIY